jgi:hypothetical protein
VLIDPDDLHALEPVKVIDEDPLALGEDGVVGGVSDDPEALGDPGHGQVLAHDPFQRPPQTSAGQLRPRFGGTAGVLAPHVPTPAAPVAPDRDQQRRRAPTQRFVRQLPGHAVAGGALAAAAPAPLVGLHDPAGQHRPVRFEPLPGDLKAELVEPAEDGQIGAADAGRRGSVAHVEVFRMGSVRTSILGRPRRLPRERRASPIYTLNCEEPSIHGSSRVGSCFDNAAAEAFFSSLEWEVLSRHDFDTTARARALVIDWCYGLYNHTRRHSAAGMKSPINYETAALTRDAA